MGYQIKALSPWNKVVCERILLGEDLRLRLGKNSPDEIKNHDFLKGINFNNSLRTQEAPYRLKIMCDTDTSNFVPIDPEKP